MELTLLPFELCDDSRAAKTWYKSQDALPIWSTALLDMRHSLLTAYF